MPYAMRQQQLAGQKRLEDEQKRLAALQQQQEDQKRQEALRQQQPEQKRWQEEQKRLASLPVLPASPPVAAPPQRARRHRGGRLQCPSEVLVRGDVESS
jgi:hypothetical protein